MAFFFHLHGIEILVYGLNVSLWLVYSLNASLWSYVFCSTTG